MGQKLYNTLYGISFMNEMDGLTEEEIFENKEGMKEILSQVKK